MELNHLVSQTLTDLIQLVIIAVGGVVIQYLRKRLSQQQIEKAKQIAEIAVKAAEAIGAANGLDGKAKFQQALQMARDLAAKYGIIFTDAEWQALIEAAVHSLKDLGEELEAKPQDGPKDPEQPQPQPQPSGG